MLRLKIVTYNIHKGIGGVDRLYRPDRIIDVLGSCDADVVFLQEVDEGVPRSRGHRQIDLLGDALGYEHRAYGPNVKLRLGHYGNGLLSRFPLDHSENIDVSVPRKKKRGALHARMTLDVARERVRLWLFNVHLGLAEYERRIQLKQVVAWQHLHRARHDIASIIAGDFNDVWARLRTTVLEPEGYHGGVPNISTFPAFRPLRPLDRVFARGPVTIERIHRSRARKARVASDHLPLMAELCLHDSGGGAG